MGWRSWNSFGANIDQRTMVRVMDGMVSRGRLVDGKPKSLCDLGYCDVGLDDNWQKCGAGEDGYQYHDHLGRSIINRDRFPNMTAMVAYAHTLGLTAGWYANNCLCPEHKDATDEMYKQDVSYLTDVFHYDGVKLDGCGKQLDLDKWASLINKTGRKVMIENCHWGDTVPNSTWCPFNFFRTSTDIRASYESMVVNLQTTVKWAQKGLSKPGCWAYPDMLEVGCKHGPGGDADRGLTFVEARSHFGAWCIVSSPLILSHDVTNETIMNEVWPIISNTEAIAVNQAWAGHSGSPFKEASESVLLERHAEDALSGQTSHSVPAWQFFQKPLGKGEVAILMMNHAKVPLKLGFRFTDVPGLTCAPCMVRDVWNRTVIPGLKKSAFEAEVASHDSVFLIVGPIRLEEVFI